MENKFGHIKHCLLQPFLPWNTEIALQLAVPTKDNQRNASIHPPRAENNQKNSFTLYLSGALF